MTVGGASDVFNFARFLLFLWRESFLAPPSGLVHVHTRFKFLLPTWFVHSNGRIGR